MNNETRRSFFFAERLGPLPLNWKDEPTPISRRQAVVDSRFRVPAEVVSRFRKLKADEQREFILRLNDLKSFRDTLLQKLCTEFARKQIPPGSAFSMPRSSPSVRQLLTVMVKVNLIDIVDLHNQSLGQGGVTLASN